MSLRLAAPLLAALLAVPAGCRVASAPVPVPDGARTAHVVLISIDGLRPDAIEAAPAPHLLRLGEEGAAAREARTVSPSRTLPSHVSMLTGVSPEVHGITWNDDRVRREGTVRVPTVFSVAEAAGLRTAAFFGKSKFRHLLLPGAPRVVSVPRGPEVVLSPVIVQEVVDHLRFHRPNLLFVHLADPDLAGHGAGWMSPSYRWAVRRSDAAVERIRRAAAAAFGDDFVILVTSDHGGHRRGHGLETEEDVLIPWIAWGSAVRPGTLQARLPTTATAATVLWLLGLPVPEGWEPPVREAFHARGADGRASDAPEAGLSRSASGSGPRSP
jgi:arylsulfatase A-like enzyme